MTTTNGWPGKPGVPLNPEEPGYHWVKGCDGEDTIVFWRGHGGDTHHENGDLKELDHWSKYPMWIAQEWTYRGPCLTPDQATALQKKGCARDQTTTQYCAEAAGLQARVAELEAALAALQRDASQEIATDELVRRLQHLGDWQAADRIEALQKRLAELEGALATARLVPPLNPDRWRGAINDALTNWMDSILDDETPKDALRRLIQHEIIAALDPAVSQSAADLVTTARLEGMEQAVSQARARADFWGSGNNKEAKIRHDEARKIAAAIRAAAKEVKL